MGAEIRQSKVHLDQLKADLSGAKNTSTGTAEEKASQQTRISQLQAKISREEAAQIDQVYIQKADKAAIKPQDDEWGPDRVSNEIEGFRKFVKTGVLG